MISQFTFNKIIQLLPRNKKSIAFKLFFILRRLFIKLSNPNVNFFFYDANITIPLSHDLPLNKTAFPQYSDNLGQIARLLSKDNLSLKVIDIGANVGDTVCIIKYYSTASILCIEGNNNFIGLLEKNTSQFKDVSIYKAFAGEHKTDKLKLNTELGTANISIDGYDGESIELQTLDEILIKVPDFANANLLKIDTDGFDNTIIRSAKEFITNSHPVIFFEYDPYFLGRINEDGISIFDFLEERDYIEMILYDNWGNFYGKVNVSDKNAIREFHEIAKRKQGVEYFDICIYTIKHLDIFRYLSN